MKTASASELIAQAATSLGLTVHREPEWGWAGYLELPDGTRSYFRNHVLSLNPVGASDVVRDKQQTSYFLREAGFKVPEDRTFFSRSWCDWLGIGYERCVEAACDYGEQLGWPVIAKPNGSSQGNGVELVTSASEMATVAEEILQRYAVMLVQPRIVGRDFRVVVLDEEIVSAYERVPLAVIGDGESSVAALLAHKQQEFVESGRDTVIDADDPRIARMLARRKMTLESVVAAGAEVKLLANANLSAGGDSIECTDSVHPEFARIAIEATKLMSLRICGVDLIASTSISDKPDDYSIIELNSVPGFDNYAAAGAEQLERVQGIYTKIVRALMSGSPVPVA